MSETQEAKTPEVTVVHSEGGAVTATQAIDFSKPAAEDTSLLAGKFKTPADLEKAYKELESKLGQAKPQQPAEEVKPETEAEEKAKTEEKPEEKTEELDDVYAAYGENIGKQLKDAGIDPTAAMKEFDETGTISEENREPFDKHFGKEVVDAYVRGLQAARTDLAGTVDATVAAVETAVGGKDSLTKLKGWMATNLTPAEVEAYNATLSTGDAAKITEAVKSYNARYLADVGKEGKLLGGRAAAADEGYPSPEAWLKDMADPRYKTDAAFRDAVAAKMVKSQNLALVR